MYIVVTGAAGFVGANIVKALSDRGGYEIIAVDDLKQGDKFNNLVDCEIADYFDREEFMEELENGAFDGVIGAVLHQGACSDTTESDGRFMMQNNYRYTRNLFDYCMEEEIQFIYASSAAVYGAGAVFREQPEHESPLNVYGYSKFLFDQYLRRNWGECTAQVVGLRYFNVYGEREQHKGRMASVAYHFFNQYRANGKVRLLKGPPVTPTANSVAILSRWRTRSRSIFIFSTTPRNRASSMSAAAPRRALMMWRWRRSTPAANTPARRPCRWPTCRPPASSNTSRFPAISRANTRVIRRPISVPCGRPVTRRRC